MPIQSTRFFTVSLLGATRAVFGWQLPSRTGRAAKADRAQSARRVVVIKGSV